MYTLTAGQVQGAPLARSYQSYYKSRTVSFFDNDTIIVYCCFLLVHVLRKLFI